MSAWKYKQVMPKVLVKTLQLIDPKEIVDLVDKPIEHIYSVLTRTPYHAEISKIKSQEINSASIEEAFMNTFIRTCREIMERSPRRTRALIETILKKFDAGNVKAILRAKVAGTTPDEAMKYVLPLREGDLGRWTEIFTKSEGIADVVRHLSEMGYGPALEGALRECETNEWLLPLEVATDRFVYGQIWKNVGKLKGLDGRIARTVLGLEIDSINVRTILRCKEMRMERDQAIRFFIPLSDVFHEAELKEAVTATDVTHVLETLLTLAELNVAEDYQCLLAELIKDYEAHRSISRLETVFDRGLLRVSLRMLKRYTPFFNIGSVLALLNLMWFETRNLRVIIKGAEERISPSVVRELLILPA